MSCKFNGKISAEFTPPKTWILEKTLSFTVKGHGMTEVEWDLRRFDRAWTEVPSPTVP